MIEDCSTKEVVKCCQEYLKVQKEISKPDSRHKGRLARKGTSGRKVFIDNDGSTLTSDVSFQISLSFIFFHSDRSLDCNMPPSALAANGTPPHFFAISSLIGSNSFWLHLLDLLIIS